MKKVIKQPLICIILLSILFFACQKDSTNLDDSTAGCKVVEQFVDEVIHIKEPTTWTADKVYLFKGVIVQVESVLTIEPGTVMKFSNSSINIDPADDGKIIANGTADKRIVFTSYADNARCGNTQADGGAAQPEKGDWGGVYIDGGNNHSFTYCDFLYGGGAFNLSYTTAFYLGSRAGDAFTFDHCTVAHTYSPQDPAKDYTQFAFSANFDIDKPNPQNSRFTNNVFYDNDKPMTINPYLSVDASNKFYNPADPTQTNGRNFIHMFAINHQYGDVTWGYTEVPYVLTGGLFHGVKREKHTITIGPNVIVKFPGVASGLVSYEGGRVIDLHSSAVLTSLKDDAHGGDSNGDGAATKPEKGDWTGFQHQMPDSRDNYWINGDNMLYAKF